MGLGATLLESCLALPFPQVPGSMSKEDIERLLAKLDVTLAKLQASKPGGVPLGLAPKIAQKGHEPAKRLLGAMVLVGAYRELPQSTWTEPRVSGRLAEALPEVHDTISLARDHLLEFSDEERAKIDQKLRADPNLPMRVMEQIDDVAKQWDIPIEQRTVLRTTTAQLAWRMRTQGTKAVSEEVSFKWQRAVSRKSAMLGMQLEGEGQPQEEAPKFVRAKFHTNVAPDVLHRAACSLSAKVTLDGKEHPVDLAWNGTNEHCPVSGTDPIQGVVRLVPDARGHEVQIDLIIPPDASEEAQDDLRETVVQLGRELRSRSEILAKPVRKGDDGESCRSNDDCTHVCVENICQASNEPVTNSKKLLKDTGQVAKWGAILLIPPICFVGILVLLTALFMVIVAGFMSLGGD